MASMNELLRRIVVAVGGTPSGVTRNGLLRDWYDAVSSDSSGSGEPPVEPSFTHTLSVVDSGDGVGFSGVFGGSDGYGGVEPSAVNGANILVLSTTGTFRQVYLMLTGGQVFTSVNIIVDGVYSSPMAYVNGAWRCRETTEEAKPLIDYILANIGNDINLTLEAV